MVVTKVVKLVIYLLEEGGITFICTKNLCQVAERYCGEELVLQRFTEMLGTLSFAD